MEVWKDDTLNETLKINLYRSLVISVFTYGHEAWLLDTANLKMINGFNSRCLSAITNRDIRDEAVNPTFDLCTYLRARRLSHLGHILRMDSIEPVHRVVISRGIAHRTGDLFMDAPEHSSIPELITIASDRDQWREYVNQLAGLGQHGSVKANTAEETEALIKELPDGAILAYSDGGCDGNGAKGIWGKAGWGVWICRKAASARIGIADMWGPVVTDPNDDFYCDCTIASNNTGELLGMYIQRPCVG